MATKAKPTKTAKTGQKGDVEKRPADAPFPPSAANTLKDNAVSASTIAAATAGKTEDAATINAASMDKAAETLDAQEAKDREDEDNSFMGKVRRSGLVFNRNHNTGEDYVGLSVQLDPNASVADKKRTSVSPLEAVAPKTGMEVRPAKGEAFTIGDGFGADSKPEDWARVTGADGKPLFG
jgi:hypothetical protein